VHSILNGPTDPALIQLNASASKVGALRHGRPPLSLPKALTQIKAPGVYRWRSWPTGLASAWNP